MGNFAPAMRRTISHTKWSYPPPPSGHVFSALMAHTPHVVLLQGSERSGCRMGTPPFPHPRPKHYLQGHTQSPPPPLPGEGEETTRMEEHECTS